jgi:hypothetical protein
VISYRSYWIKRASSLLCSEPETQSKEEVEMIQDFDAFRENSSPSLYTQKMISGVRHMDFTMHPILDWLVGGTDFNGEN